MKRRYLKDAVNMAGYSSQPLSVFEELDRASADAVVELMALLTRRLVLGDEEGDDGIDDGIDDDDKHNIDNTPAIGGEANDGSSSSRTAHKHVRVRFQIIGNACI